MGKGKDSGYDGGIQLWPDGLAGISKDGLFGTVASWVDTELAPGETDQTTQLGLAKTLATMQGVLAGAGSRVQSALGMGAAH